MSVFRVKSAAEFHDIITSSTLPVVVKFGAKWCAPCKKIEPVLESLTKTHSSKLMFLSVDVDEVPELAASYQLMGVPSVFVFDKGCLVKRMSTSVTPRSVKKLIEENLA